jgi:methionyl-tRNA synthetase
MTRTYITTPIYYVNDKPHIGHCYTTTVADALARFARLVSGRSESVFFLTGTDEHADKVVTTAAANGMSAIQWADRNAEEFRKAFAFIEASNDDFIRTTQDRHKSKVIEYVSALIKSGSIYPGTYEGWYDENQEEYVTETVAKENEYKSSVTGKPLVRRSEKCYFFKLSAYQGKLQALFDERPGFVQPAARRNEVLGRFKQGLQDVPVSRPVTDDPATQFGIRVPGDEQHRIYVWIDALFNYLSVVDTQDRRAFWPTPAGDTSSLTHFIAKDILWFHAVIWPAMLLALRDADPAKYDWVGLPGTVYSHAYWVREGRKMSKSLGNFVDLDVLRKYADKFSLDALRWYLLTQGPLGENDADFSHGKFVEVFNADLANGIGNCASRVGNMIEKYFGGVVPGDDGTELVVDPAAGMAVAPSIREFFNWAATCSVASRQTLDGVTIDNTPVTGFLRAMDLVRNVDQFINATRPFSIAKRIESDPKAKSALGCILYQCAEALRIASILLSPALIAKMPQLWQAWNIPFGSGQAGPAGTAGPPNAAPRATLAELCEFGGKHALRPGHKIAKGDSLFMRADPKEPAPT